MKRTPLFAATRLALAAAAAAPPPAPTKDLPQIPGVIALKPRAGSASEYELIIFGDIGDNWWGESVTAKSVVEQLNALEASVTQINVRINSYGGSVSDGLAIYNSLKRHQARKVVTVDGVAMSSASLIAMAGDEVLMPETSLLMIHAPWGIAQGNANDMRVMAEVLDTYAQAMAGAYATKTKKSREDMLALLKDGQDHYYVGEEAVAQGFADKLIDAVEAEEDDNADASAERGARAAGLSRFIPGMSQRVVELAVAASARTHPNSAALKAAGPQAKPATTVPPVVVGEGEDDMRLKKQAKLRDPEPGAGSAAPPATPTREQILAQVKARNDELNVIARPFMARAGVREIYDAAMTDPAVSVEAFRQQVLDRLGQDATPASSPRVEAGNDSRDNFINGATNAILARSGLIKPEAGNEYNGAGLQRMIRVCLARAGVGNVDRLEGRHLAERIFGLQTSSDFPLLLANSANKALRAAYDAAPSTWNQWCATGSVSDFKANTRVQVGTFNSLATIAEGGEYNYGSLAEEAETITAVTKGRGLMLSRQMIINDDLGAFVRRAQMLGFAASRTVNEDAYARLFASTAMSDTGALFNATAVATAGGHANYTSSGTAISVASIAVGEGLMAAQKDKSLRTPLNITPRFLLCPRGKRSIAWGILNSPADPASSNANAKNYAASLALEIVADSNLDANSATAWYLIADPMQCPVIEVDFLNGEQAPYVEETVDFDTDAIKLKARLDYGVQAIDWRGGYKNAGA